MDNQYIEIRDNVYWIKGTRISFDSIVYAFLDGLSPETIAAECYPTLQLEQVYGAITFYLSNRAEIDAYLLNADREFQKIRNESNESSFSRKLTEARRQILKADS